MNKINFVEMECFQNGFPDIWITRDNRGPKLYYSHGENRAARMTRFFLAWLSRHVPGAQLPRRERKAQTIQQAPDWASLVADAIYQPEDAECDCGLSQIGHRVTTETCPKHGKEY